MSTPSSAPPLSVRLLKALAWLFLATAVAALVALPVLFNAPPTMLPSVVLPLLAVFVLLLAGAQLLTVLEDIATSQRAIAAALQKRAQIAPESEGYDPAHSG